MSEQPRSRMTPELLGILGVGVTLAGLVITVWIDIRGDIKELREETREVRQQVSTTEGELRNDMREDHRTLRMDIRRVEEEINSVLSRVTVTETSLGFIKEKLE
ncbi:MAG: hypothetical protein OXN89_01325 [Bryobacterales bacterium]|nr:hypothetical protein [Bryobacterales bacterium]